MQNKNIFRLLSLILLTTFAFSILTTSVMGAPKGLQIMAAGVVSPDGDILFPQTDNFISMKTSTGVYLIEVDAKLQCLHNGATQEAIGVKLITPHSRFQSISSPLFQIDSDVTGVCNQTAVYVVKVGKLGSNTLEDGVFSFQITGVKGSEG